MSKILTTGDYRVFVGAFPTGELAERIQALRLRHDPQTARITAPHVTLAGAYWRTGPATPENERQAVDRLRAVECQLRSLDLILGGVRVFPRSTVLYLDVEPTEALLAVRRMLLQALGADKHRQFAPHLTLTMRLERAETRSLLARLKQSEWHTGRWTVPIERLCLMQRGPDDRAWRCIHCIEMLKGRV